jgi:hypothetical protein
MGFHVPGIRTVKCATIEQMMGVRGKGRRALHAGRGHKGVQQQ